VSIVFAAGAVAALWAAGCGGAIDGGAQANADAGKDAPYVTLDAGRHDAPGRDSNTIDTGADVAIACDQGVCPSPADVSAFQPTWIPPTGAHQNACTPQLIDEFYTSCLSTNSSQLCAAFNTMADAAHQACGKCLTSQYADAQWGPIVYAKDDVETNTAGCIALLDPSQIDCAKAIESLLECNHAACDDICSGASAPGFDQFVQCTAASNTCGCKTYFDASQCQKKVAQGGGPAAPCLVGQTFEDFYYATAAVFCGQ
jgi:hypothetical protein